MESQELQMTFDPNTIEDLGIRMYSTLPPVLAELIANAYDADASLVELQLIDSAEKKEIIVKDNGDGMDFNEINEKFLRIGRKRRREDAKNQTTKKGRKIIGKKGLGKLAFFGIAHNIKIITKKTGLKNVFVMDWNALKKTKIVYKPKIIKKNEPFSQKEHGTKIILRQIQRTSKFNAEELADSIARIFIVDPGFRITIQHNSEKPITITNGRRFQSLDKEIVWDVPKQIQASKSYFKSKKITGQLMATKKPISPNLRGVILFSRKKLVNRSEFFTDSVSSHFFSYLTGWLEVDFIDDLKDDVISTNRQSLNWDNLEMEKLRKHLRGLINWLERDWRKKRDEIREEKVGQATGINIHTWFSRLPDDIRRKIEPVVQAIAKESEMSEETHCGAIKNIHEIVPEYPLYHWRHLHSEVRSASELDYQKRDYYRAFIEAAKKYINSVRAKSGSTASTDSGMMGAVFGEDPAKPLKVARKFKKPNKKDFNKATIDDIERGQMHLSMGVVSGCRNPFSHEEIKDLRESGLFTEKDCLDALSLLSHLFSRLDHC